MIIREMKPEDAGQAASNEAEAFSMPWTEQDFSEALQYSYTYYLVAEENNHILGSCGLRHILGEGEITNVAVAGAYRRQGIGRSLLEQILKAGADRGVKAFMLEVRSSNSAALHLYEQLGFRSEGIRRSFYEKPVEDAVIMWKR